MLEIPWRDFSNTTEFPQFWYRMREISLSYVGLLDWRKSHTRFEEGKTRVSTNYFQISFKGLIGGKNKPYVSSGKPHSRLGHRRKEKTRRRRKKDQGFATNAENFEWIHPHTHLLKFNKFEYIELWWVKFLKNMVESLWLNCWMPIVVWFLFLRVVYEFNLVGAEGTNIPKCLEK